MCDSSADHPLVNHDVAKHDVANHDFVRMLRALADPNRLAIVEFLHDPIQSCCSRAEGVCGCDLEAFLGVSQPTVSHHMKQLVEAGLVVAEKRGRWVYYDLNPDMFKQVMTALEPYTTLKVTKLAVTNTTDAVVDAVTEGQ